MECNHSTLIILILTCHLRGKDLLGNAVGLAYVGTMCHDEDAVGLVEDTGGSVQSVGTTAAHELGHIFNMLHDDLGEFRHNCGFSWNLGCLYVLYCIESKMGPRIMQLVMQWNDIIIFIYYTLCTGKYHDSCFTYTWTYFTYFC